jgi:hypothetical protein
MRRQLPARVSWTFLDAVVDLPEVGPVHGIRVVVNTALPEGEVRMVSSTGASVRFVNVGTKESSHGPK